MYDRVLAYFCRVCLILWFSYTIVYLITTIIYSFLGIESSLFLSGWYNSIVSITGTAAIVFAVFVSLFVGIDEEKEEKSHRYTRQGENMLDSLLPWTVNERLSTAQRQKTMNILYQCNVAISSAYSDDRFISIILMGLIFAIITTYLCFSFVGLI